MERLDEFTKDEWFDVMRRIKPGVSEREFNNQWAKFQRDKALHQKPKLQ